MILKRGAAILAVTVLMATEEALVGRTIVLLVHLFSFGDGLTRSRLVGHKVVILERLLSYVIITIQLLLAWLCPFGDQCSSFTLY